LTFKVRSAKRSQILATLTLGTRTTTLTGRESTKPSPLRSPTENCLASIRIASGSRDEFSAMEARIIRSPRSATVQCSAAQI
jgi:hypothetical protein